MMKEGPRYQVSSDTDSVIEMFSIDERNFYTNVECFDKFVSGVFTIRPAAMELDSNIKQSIPTI